MSREQYSQQKDYRMGYVLRRGGWRCLVLVSISLVYLSSCRAMMTGGISQLENPYQYKEISDGVKVFLKKLKANEGRAYEVVCATLKASSQVVQGTLYRVAMEVVPEGNDNKVYASACVGGRPGKDGKFVCFTIWSRPWLEDKKARLIVEEKPNISKYKDCLTV